MKNLCISLGFLLLFILSASAQNTTRGSMVSFASGKDTIQAYLCQPEGTGPFPAIMLIHEWWGLNDWVKDNAASFAKQGYVALALDLYRGKVATKSDEAHELMRGLPEDRALRDMKAGFSFLQSKKNIVESRIGCIGWCMGGGYALSSAVNIPQLAACVVCYGRLLTDSSAIESISCPLLGIFGSEDRGIPPDAVNEFDATAKALGKNSSVTIYKGAGHAFMNPNNTQGYDSTSTTDAWEKINKFFKTNLSVKK